MGKVRVTVKKVSSLRGKLMTALFTAIATSAVSYFWSDIVRWTPVMVNKMFNRQVMSTPAQPQTVPAVFTTFQKQQ